MATRRQPGVDSRVSWPTSRALTIPTLAQAAVGNRSAVRDLLSTSNGVTAALANRLAPQISAWAADFGIDTPDEWKADVRQNAIMRLLLENGLSELGAALDSAGVPWLPLKGMGLVPRLYKRTDCRPTSDLDVLIPADAFSGARSALSSSGWQSIHTGRAYESWLAAEGYNWQAANPTGIMLELHFRLWGPVDPALPRTLLQRAVPAPELGSMARVSGPAESYITSAAHFWNSPRPRVLLYLLDLFLLSQSAKDDTFAETVITTARRHDLRLFVGLAAALAADLWTDEQSTKIAASLLGELKPPERAALAIALRHSTMDTTLGILVLARLMAGRKSRTGWRAPFRRIWPHPGIAQESRARDPLTRLRQKLQSRHPEE